MPPKRTNQRQKHSFCDSEMEQDILPELGYTPISRYNPPKNAAAPKNTAKSKTDSQSKGTVSQRRVVKPMKTSKKVLPALSNLFDRVQMRPVSVFKPPHSATQPPRQTVSGMSGVESRTETESSDPPDTEIKVKRLDLSDDNEEEEESLLLTVSKLLIQENSDFGGNRLTKAQWDRTGSESMQIDSKFPGEMFLYTCTSALGS